MLRPLRAIPNGVRIFFCYAILVLAFLGLTLPLVVDQAVEAPVSGIGLVWMLLLAYLIFTMTLVLPREPPAPRGYPCPAPTPPAPRPPRSRGADQRTERGTRGQALPPRARPDPHQRARRPVVQQCPRQPPPPPAQPARDLPA